MTRFLLPTFVFLLSTSGFAIDLPLPVSDIAREEPVDFQTEIMPILKRNCLACHHEKEAEGGLVMETLEHIRTGGDSGEGVIANDVDASLVFVRATGSEEPLMPPEDNSVGAEPLTPEELGLLKLWIEQGAKGSDVTTSEMIQWQPIPESIRSVYAMDVSADGQLVVVGRGNRVVLFDLQSKQVLGNLVDPSLQMGDVADYDLIQSVAASPDGNRIATGGYRAVRIWKKELAEINPSTTPLSNARDRIAVSRSETLVALKNAIGDIEFWDLSSNQKQQTLTGHTEPIVQLGWTTDDAVLFTVDQSGRIIAWDPTQAKPFATVAINTATLDLSVANDNQHVATVDITGKVHVARLADDRRSFSIVEGIAADISDARSVMFAGDETLSLIVATSAGPVKCISMASKQVTSQIQHGAVVDALAVTTDQSKLVTGGTDGITKVWNLADSKELVTLQGQSETKLLVARVTRDANRQKAMVARLNKQTEELKKALTKEDEVLKKTTEEHEKAKTSLAAEVKKHDDAVALVTKTQDRIDNAKSQAEQSQSMMTSATKTLSESQAKSDSIVQELTAGQARLVATEKEVASLQKQIDDLMAKKTQAVGKADLEKKKIAETQAAKDAVAKQIADAQKEIESAKKLAADAKTESENATKELANQQKAVTEAVEAKKKSEAELAKRKQAFDTATSARARAAGAIPAHQSVIDQESRRQQLLDRQLITAQSLLNPSGNSVVNIDIQADSSTAIIAYRDGSVRHYRLDNGEPLLDFQTIGSRYPTQVAFVGDALVSLTETTVPAMVQRQPRWVLERTIGTARPESMISDRVTALDFHPSGTTLAIGSGPPSRFGDVKVVAVETGELVRDLGEVHSDTVFGIAFSPDGRQLASAAADKTIRVHDLATGNLVRSLEGHTHHVLSLDWQDDGQTIASASADQSIKVWN
ncbi:MAG: c-type cytochrome domain-containing protein, partial [Planctomycetota bacterium]